MFLTLLGVFSALVLVGVLGYVTLYWRICRKVLDGGMVSGDMVGDTGKAMGEIIVRFLVCLVCTGVGLMGGILLVVLRFFGYIV